MSDENSTIAPLWTLHVTLASAVLAIIAYLFGSSHTSSATAVALVGVTYLLYKWGQYRDPPSKYSDDDDKKRREMEMEAEAGAYGGNM